MCGAIIRISWMGHEPMSNNPIDARTGVALAACPAQPFCNQYKEKRLDKSPMPPRMR